MTPLAHFALAVFVFGFCGWSLSLVPWSLYLQRTKRWLDEG